jgi:hypothetical protein
MEVGQFSQMGCRKVGDMLLTRSAKWESFAERGIYSTSRLRSFEGAGLAELLRETRNPGSGIWNLESGIWKRPGGRETGLDGLRMNVDWAAV